MWTKENIGNQTGKTAIVTGANTGIGYETALALYEAGAHLVLACRNIGNAENAIAAMQKKGGKGTLEAAVLDLSSLPAVAQFAQQFLEKHQQLNLLINNAGVMVPPASKTKEGFELQFGVNFIGHFALTGHLYPLLQATPEARIVTLSSLAYLSGEINFDNLRTEIAYDAMREYCQSKLACLLFAVELQRRISAAGDQVLSIAAHPGGTKTDLSRYMTADEFNAATEKFGELMDTWQGALPSLYAALSDEAAGGALYGPDSDGGIRGYPAFEAIAPNGMDTATAKRLWTLAEECTGIGYPAIK